MLAFPWILSTALTAIVAVQSYRARWHASDAVLWKRAYRREWSVAERLERGLRHVFDTSTHGGRYVGSYCDYCDAEGSYQTDLNHDATCPAAIADCALKEAHELAEADGDIAFDRLVKRTS